jgi:hypothetical protein
MTTRLWATPLLLSLAVSFFACGKSQGGDAPPSMGEGGLAEHGGSAGTGTGGASAGGTSQPSGGACDGGLPTACCTAADRLPCRDFSEAECAAADYCDGIRGTGWKVGDPPTPAGPRVYVGCQSQCEERAGADAFFCVLQSSNPARCWLVASEVLVPDGWSGFFECRDLPEGACIE